MKNSSVIELRQEKLQNGLSLISNEVLDTETVAISGSIKSGAMCDEPGKFGTAELAARLLTRGTKTRSASQISQSIEELGATLSFENHDETVSFSARCYFGVLDQILELIGECLTDPAFPEEEISLYKNEILADIKSQEDDTRASAYRKLNSIIFGKDASYGRDPLGLAEDLQRLTRNDLIGFHREKYDPATIVFAITGRYDFGHVTNQIEKTLGQSKATPPGPTSFKESPYTPQVSKVEMNHKSQIDLALGTLGVPRASPQYYSLNLGNLILGRLGLYGRLGKNVREEKGVAYYSYSVLQAKLYAGQFGIFAGVNPKNVEKALLGIVQEVDRITAEPISDKELETAKRNLMGSLLLSLDTSAERVGILHDIAYYDLGLNFLERNSGILGAVTSDQVLKDCNQFMSLDRISLVAAGPVRDSQLNLPKDLLKVA
ncbi:MAG: M16 family metallopeptidase [Nitrososphaerales archaeon]